jgi:hypothetical protein
MMKRNQLLLSAFLLMLYIVPVILAPSSSSSTILAEPNTTKEFSTSYDRSYEASDQSITSISETLPDDMLYYPDEFTFDMITATSSNRSDYDRLDSMDAVYWESSSPNAGIMFFDVSYSGISSFDYFLYSTIPSGTMSLYNGTAGLSESWDEVLSITNGWNDDTVLSSDYVNVDHPDYGEHTLIILLSGSCSIDYLGVSFHAMTLSEGGYAESFSDVSDWTLGTIGGLSAGEYGYTSDGDVLEGWIMPNVTSNEYFLINSDIFSVALDKDSYIEFRCKVETGVIVFINLRDSGGTYRFVSVYPSSTSYATYKVFCGNIAGLDEITGIRIAFDDYPDTTASGNLSVWLDYLRISNSTNMGWQHDGSTTVGVTNTTNMAISSDGDILACFATGGTYGECRFYPDITATKTGINTNYYPFLAIDISVATTAWYLDATWSDDSSTVLHNYYAGTGISRYNLRAVSAGKDLKYLTFRVLNFAGLSVYVNYINAYSIADFTYTGSGTSTDDILFVDSGILYCQATSITSMILDHDPALSFTSSEGCRWNVTTSSGVPQTDYYVGAWAGYSSETSGDLATGTLTDVRIKFTDSANIAAITFLSPIPQWNQINEVQLIFNIPLDEWALNMFLILLGMILVPASTGYLVYGGKNSFSTDKLLYGLFAFMMGWALIFGGIFA